VKRQKAETRGRGAETLAAMWLWLHGWRILARRARVPGGEVDIVARRGQIVALRAPLRTLPALRSIPTVFAGS